MTAWHLFYCQTALRPGVSARIPQVERHFGFFEQNLKFRSETRVKLLTAQMQSSRARYPTCLGVLFHPLRVSTRKREGIITATGLLAPEGFPVINDRCVAGAAALRNCLTSHAAPTRPPVRGGLHQVIEKENPVKNVCLSHHKSISML